MYKKVFLGTKELFYHSSNCHLIRYILYISMKSKLIIGTNFREQEKALKAAAAGVAGKKGPMGGGGIKKSGKK